MRSLYDCHNTKGIKLITKLRLDLNHLREHNVKRSFQELINASCNCGYEFKPMVHFFLHCHFFTIERITFSGLYII